jgi:hypothetical protein
MPDKPKVVIDGWEQEQIVNFCHQKFWAGILQMIEKYLERAAWFEERFTDPKRTEHFTPFRDRQLETAALIETLARNLGYPPGYKL